MPVERILVLSVLVDFTSGLLSLGFHFTFGKDCRKENKRVIVVMGRNHLCTLQTEHFFLAKFFSMYELVRVSGIFTWLACEISETRTSSYMMENLPGRNALLAGYHPCA